MRTHEYKIGKGYPEELKGTVVTWNLPTTIAEALERGFFKDESVLLHRACANLNVDKGHAIQDAVTEAVEKGEPIPTVEQMRQIAESTMADGEVRRRGTGGQKAKAATYNTIVEKATARWANASPSERAMLVDLGIFNEDGSPVTVDVPASKPKQAGANGEPAKQKKQKAAK